MNTINEELKLDESDDDNDEQSCINIERYIYINNNNTH